MNLFGKKKTVAPPTQRITNEDTIQLLRASLETLEKREAHIGKRVELALAEARQKAIKKDKRGALFALKRKRLFESEITKNAGTRSTLESQISALESANLNMHIFNAMKSGAQALKGIRGDIDSDKVDEMLDEIQEEKDIHDQISDAISRPFGGDPCDDDELLQELAELEELALAEEALKAPARMGPPSTVTSTGEAIVSPNTVFNLPTAPTTTIRVRVINEVYYDSSLFFCPIGSTKLFVPLFFFIDSRCQWFHCRIRRGQTTTRASSIHVSLILFLPSIFQTYFQVFRRRPRIVLLHSTPTVLWPYPGS